MSSRSNSSSSLSTADPDDSPDDDKFYDAVEATGTLVDFAVRYNQARQRERPDLTTLSAHDTDSSGSDVFFSPNLKVTLVKNPDETVTGPSGLENDGNGNSREFDRNRTLTSSSSTSTAVHMDSCDHFPGSSSDGNSLPRDTDVEVQEESRRQRMEKMRQRLDNDVEEPVQDETSPSEASSVDGVDGATSSSKIHPFTKVVDHDTASVLSGVSIGRLGRSAPTSISTGPSIAVIASQPSATIVTQRGGNNTLAEEMVESASKPLPFVPKPDVVASCSENDFPNKIPKAPPRTKRSKTVMSDNQRPNDLPVTADASNGIRSSRHDSASSSGSLQSPQPPSPTVSIRSATKDLDKTLDSMNQKFWIVKAQDEAATRAKSSGPKVLRRTESLPKEMMDAVDPSGSGSLGGYSSHSNSNSSTLNNSQGTTKSVTKGDSEVPAEIQGSSPGNATNHHISSLVSALAKAEEKRDNDLLQVNPSLRTRTDSGKLLSDLEILEQVTVRNLDTGEIIPLSSADDKIPKCVNPLSLHIMNRMNQEFSDGSLAKEGDSDDGSVESNQLSSAASQEDPEPGVRNKTVRNLGRYIKTKVKDTVDKAKKLGHSKHTEKDNDIDTNGDILVGGQDPLVKMRASHSHKGPYDFDHLQQVQDLSGEHSGPVWCMKFSNCGKLLATAGQDSHIRIWVLKDHLPYFQDMRSKHTVDKVSPTPSQESIVSQHSHHSAEEMIQASENSDPRSPFVPRPLCIYRGHQADLLDIAWSKSYFLLSSSMDRTVRLWHISRRECLCCFQHIDFVTAIAFHPRDDRYFLSGSLDGKLRLWNIPDKKVALWNEVQGHNNLITTANFCQSGKFAVVGTYDGRILFYHTEQLKYHTQIIVHRRKKIAGKKITGIEPIPGEDKILVTCNDSRIRLYDLRDLSLTCKYKGCVNSSSQIKATVSHDGKYIVSGSENQCVYIWKTYHDYSKFSSVRRDRNGFWEAVRAHNAVVTSAIFAPDPDIIVKQIEAREKELEQEHTGNDVSTVTKSTGPTKTLSGFVKSPTLTKPQSPSPSYTPTGYILVSADFAGCIKVFLSKVKPKHSSLPASALA